VETFLWFSGSAGVRFNGDLSAAVVFAGAGAGYGVGRHLVAVSWTPGASVPRTTDTSISTGFDVAFFGGSASGKYIPNTVSLKGVNVGGSQTTALEATGILGKKYQHLSWVACHRTDSHTVTPQISVHQIMLRRRVLHR
jgi:hypothetical protein